jgi:hypothetical protein
MSDRANQLANLRVWLAGTASKNLAEFLGCVRDELSTRLAFDSANYVTRAIACLDERRLADQLSTATTEPPVSA